MSIADTPAAKTAKTVTAKPAKPAAKKVSARKAGVTKAAVKKVARKVSGQVAKPALPAPVKVKATRAKKVSPVAVKTAAPKVEKVKLKLVRDSFTMPAADFALVDQLKSRAIAFKRPAKKSELLRAGLQVLVGLTDAKLKAVLDGLTPLKPGRPKLTQE